MDTPKKSSKRGRKSKSTTIDDFCRACGCSLKIISSDSKSTSYISSENVFAVPGRAGVSSRPLLTFCRDLGYNVHEGDGLSSRVCATCARKIRKAAELKLFLDVRLAPKEQDSPERFKRMSTSPGFTEYRKSARTQSPGLVTFKLSKRNENGDGANERNVRAKKKIAFEEASKENQDMDFDIPTMNKSQISRDDINHLLSLNNVDFKHDEKPKVKVVIPRNSSFSIRTPPDKTVAALIKNLCNKNWKSAANCLFNYEELKQEILAVLSRTVSKEIVSYCKGDSILKRSSSDEISSLSNKKIVEEAATTCPVWFACVSGACNSHKSKEKLTKAINPIALITAVAAKHNNHCMSAVAKRISIILLHSGAKTQDFTRLNHLGLCTSHKQAIRDQREMGKNHDSQVIGWKKEIERNKRCMNLIQQIENVKSKDIKKVDLSQSTCEKLEGCCKETTNELVLDLEEEGVNLQDNDYKVDVDDLEKIKARKQKSFRIVADNLDFSVTSRIQTEKIKNKSIHWTHQYAIQDRVMFPPCTANSDKQPAGQKKIVDLELSELLPTKKVNDQIECDFVVLVSRIITKFLKAFEPFKDIVVHHIPHEYTREMSRKSDVCCLGLEFFNTNVSGEMAQFLMADQSKYVPQVDKSDGKVILDSVFLDGDQLTEERARNVQWVFQDGDNTYDRLEGFDPVHADWHAKVNLYQVENKIFLKDESSAEIGTTRASINRTAKTNAGKGVKDFNAYRDFHDREIEAHVLASFMTFTGIEELDGNPSNLQIPVKWDDRVQKRSWLCSLIRQFLAKYVFQDQEAADITEQVVTLEGNLQQPFVCRAPECEKQYKTDAWRVRHEINKHSLRVQDGCEGDNRNSLGYYKCTVVNCGLVYKTAATMKRHLRRDHKDIPVDESHEVEEKKEQKDDYQYNYHKAKMSLGLILFDINDAIREGDGERLVSLYKAALLFYKCYGHTKYAYTCLLFLTKVTAILPYEKAKSLTANRFCNNHGKIGKNISLDLRLEQLNGLLKSYLKSLGPNFNEESAQRVAASIGKVEKILAATDQECNLTQEIKTRSKTDPTEAVSQIVKDLMSQNVFVHIPGRAGYPSFPKFDSNLLRKLDYRDLYRWMKEKLSEWSKRYEQ